MGRLTGLQIHITGVVQGVGFRPFVYGLAQEMNLNGWVRNTSAGVDIVVEGAPDIVANFRQALEHRAPPLARIDQVTADEIPVNGFTSFEIIHSQSIAGAFQPISPDMSICSDCRRELFDPADRRFRYPFINCTNCGPRFTIITNVPYDRPQTTMAPFPMCPDCEREYNDPLDRRFHAQPVACPICGPQVWLEERDRLFAAGEQAAPVSDRRPGPGEEYPSDGDAICLARQLLCEGKVVAIKGLGGFHLACDATNVAAVAELRRRKLRVDKPFAVMMWDLDAVARHCQTSEAESALLNSRERPIVILQRNENTAVAANVAPGQHTLGVMLPYTPLHYLLLEPAESFPEALVMTSGNVSEEPIAFANREARQRLVALADVFLLHDRAIRTRCDDSVMRVLPADGMAANGNRQPSAGKIHVPLRRSRGYAPFPIKLPYRAPPLLAVGGELKNAFCITREQYAFLSHHVGDMETYETFHSFEDGVVHFERLFRVQPQAIAHDLHPDYLATRYAQERAAGEGVPTYGVQHHYAHIVACLAEHAHPGDRPVIGVAFDGTGYGDDGAIWGGEFLLADYDGYRRVAHLEYVPLPGADKAVKEPWRMALSWLHRAGLPWTETVPPVTSDQLPYTDRLPRATQLQVIGRQLETGLNAVPTSSMGRLFDAVAALAGVRQVVNYEAQAAIELEALIDSAERGSYAFAHHEDRIDAVPVITAVVDDLHAGESRGTISARFHNGVARMVADTCRRLSRQYGVSEVALSGGVWQNMALLANSLERLHQQGLTVLIHHQVPANDGGLALGQAVVAARKLRNANDH